MPAFLASEDSTLQGTSLNFSRSLARSLALVPSLLVASGLNAQSAGTQPPEPASDATKDKDVVELDELEVHGERPVNTLSSPRFTRPLVDVPQTFTVVPQSVFNQQGAQTLTDVLRNTPGITFTAGEGGNVASGDNFTMRGFDTSGSIFIDGVRDSGAYSRPVYNTEQVEIAKGPAGADTGRGGASGYVNLQTKSPKLENFATGTASYGISEDGGDPQRSATLDFNRDLSGQATHPGTAFRLNLSVNDSGVPGRDYVENTGWGASPSLAFGLGTPTRVILAASVNRQDNLPDSGLPVVAAGLPLIEDPAGAPLNRPSAANFGSVDQSNYYGYASEDYEIIKNQRYLVRLEHDLNPDLRLFNQTVFAATDRDLLNSYITNSSAANTTFSITTVPVNPATGARPAPFASFDPNTFAVTPRRVHLQTDNRVVNNQTQLTADFDTGPASHTFGLGLDLNRESQYSPTWQFTGGTATDLYNPDARRATTVATTPYRAANDPYTDVTIESAALYAFDTVGLGDYVDLTGTYRAEHYQLDSFTRNPRPQTPPGTFVEEIDEEADGVLLSWKAGAVLKPAKNGRIYFAYGNTYTPPGSSFTVSATATNQNNLGLKPQESRNTELGTKWDFFKGRLSTSLAVFRTENLNVVSTDATTGLRTQDISQEVEGAEFGVSGRITSEWLVFGGISHLDSTYKSAGTTSSADDGAELRYTPRLSANLWTTYAIFRRFTIGGGVQYTDTVSRATSTTAGGSATTNRIAYSLAEIPDYWVFNALAAYEVSKNLTVRLNVNNVFDEDYFRLNNNGGRYYPGAPRNFVLSADYKF